MSGLAKIGAVTVTRSVAPIRGGEVEQIYCHSCGRVATVHVDVMLVVTPASPTAAIEKRKHAGIWLCDECRKAMGKLMTRDTELQERVAAALTSKPRVIYRTYAGGQNAD